MIDLSDVCRNSRFGQKFLLFFIIHPGNLRLVKIVQKSVKIQGTFQLLISGSPATKGIGWGNKFWFWQIFVKMSTRRVSGFFHPIKNQREYSESNGAKTFVMLPSNVCDKHRGLSFLEEGYHHQTRVSSLIGCWPKLKFSRK